MDLDTTLVLILFGGMFCTGVDFCRRIGARERELLEENSQSRVGLVTSGTTNKASPNSIVGYGSSLANYSN